MKSYKRFSSMKILIIFFMSLVLLTSCKGEANESLYIDITDCKKTTLATEIVFKDDLNNTVTVNNPQRVAALTGSYAHIWTLAGGGVSVITDDAYDQDRLNLDENVISVGHIKKPNSELLINSGADFVILSSNIPAHIELAKLLDKMDIPYAYFSVETFSDYLNMLGICSKITGEEDYYQKNGLNIQKDIDRTIKLKEGKESPKVLLIRAYSTGFKAKNSKDNMTGVMLMELGCTNIADSDKSMLEELSLEKIIKEDPDFIFVTTMGNTEKALDIIAEKLKTNPAWSTLSAVKNGRYVVLDKQLFHEKPNDRWGESYEILANILYGQKYKE